MSPLTCVRLCCPVRLTQKMKPRDSIVGRKRFHLDPFFCSTFLNFVSKMMLSSKATHSVCKSFWSSPSISKVLDRLDTFASAAQKRVVLSLWLFVVKRGDHASSKASCAFRSFDFQDRLGCGSRFESRSKLEEAQAGARTYSSLYRDSSYRRILS